MSSSSDSPSCTVAFFSLFWTIWPYKQPVIFTDIIFWNVLQSSLHFRQECKKSRVGSKLVHHGPHYFFSKITSLGRSCIETKFTIHPGWKCIKMFTLYHVLRKLDFTRVFLHGQYWKCTRDLLSHWNEKFIMFLTVELFITDCGVCSVLLCAFTDILMFSWRWGLEGGGVPDCHKRCQKRQLPLKWEKYTHNILSFLIVFSFTYCNYCFIWIVKYQSKIHLCWEMLKCRELK